MNSINVKKYAVGKDFARLSCTTAELSAEIKSYFNVKDRMGTPQRLGQHIWNKFGKGGIWPKLFYTESQKEAVDLAFKDVAMSEWVSSFASPTPQRSADNPCLFCGKDTGTKEDVVCRDCERDFGPN